MPVVSPASGTTSCHLPNPKSAVYWVICNLSHAEWYRFTFYKWSLFIQCLPNTEHTCFKRVCVDEFYICFQASCYGWDTATLRRSPRTCIRSSASWSPSALKRRRLCLRCPGGGHLRSPSSLSNTGPIWKVIKHQASYPLVMTNIAIENGHL